MKRATKNILSGATVVVLAGAIGGTMWLASTNLSSDTTAPSTTSGSQGGGQIGGGGQTPPSMPGGSGSSNSGSSNSGQNGAGGSSSNSTQNSTNGTSNQGSSGTNSTNSSSSNSGSSSSQNSTNPPAKPDGESDSGSTNGGGTPPSMSGNANSGSEVVAASDGLTVPYYVAFGVESLLLGFVIMYLILSKFNERNFKETFANGDKVAIEVLGTILIGVIVTLASAAFTSSCLLKTSVSEAPAASGTSNSTVNYSAATEITESTTLADKTYSSSTADQNALLINGDIDVTASNLTVSKTGDSDGGDNTSFYGTNSAILAKSGATLTLKNSTITTDQGDSFYVTNTTAKITLTNNTIVNNDASGNFLRAQADAWGTSGSNGGAVTLAMSNQTASGNIVIDSVSTLDLSLASGSSLTGTFNGANSAKSLSLTLDKSSKLKLTGDSYVTSFSNADSSNSNIDFNGHKLYVNGVAIN